MTRTKILAAVLAVMGIAGGVQAAELSMWARSSTEAYSTAMVKAFNDTHPDKIVLNLIPNDQYVAKVGTAIAGA